MRKWNSPFVWVCMALILILGLVACSCSTTGQGNGSKATTQDAVAAVADTAQDPTELYAAKTLLIIGTTYDRFMRAAGTAADQGGITEDQWTTIYKAATVFFGVYHTARLALLEYHKAPKGQGDAAKLKETLGNALSDWKLFAAYIAPLIGAEAPTIEPMPQE